MVQDGGEIFLLGQVYQRWFHGEDECRVQRDHSYRMVE